MKEKLVYLVFKIDDNIYGLPFYENNKIIKIEKKEYLKIDNIISIKTVLKNNLNLTCESYQKTENYNIIDYNGYNILMPFSFYKIIVEETIKDDGKNLIIKKIKFKGKEINLLSINWILNSYFYIEKDKKYINNEKESKTINIENIEEKMEELKENKQSDTHFDEEKKKEIFDQIEKEIDKLKISNFSEVQKKYMKQSKSFTPQLVILYSILVGLAIVVFIAINVLSHQQQAKIAEDIKTIGSMESLIIRELQKKQEQEKNQLNEQLKEITSQLEAIQKQKEQFEKNQIIALNTKTKEIEDDYQKKLEEEKNKLNRGLISKTEYDKRVKELLAEKEKRLQEARNQSDAQRKAFQQQMEAKEKELKDKENSYKQALAEKEKQIQQANEAYKAAEEKLALSEEAQKKMAAENEQLKQSSSMQIKLREEILSYYKSILVSYKKDDRNSLKKALNDFYSFIINNPSAAIMAEDEKLFDKFVIDIIVNELNTKESDESKKLEKTKLFEKAFNEHKKGNLLASYESYYLAFMKYDISVENERFYFDDFLKLVYEKQNQETSQLVETSSTPLFNSILNAYQNKNYYLVIQLANNYLSQYPNSKNATAVVEYKIKAELNAQIKEQENAAANIFQKAKTAYNAQDYDTSVKLLLELFSKYGGTSYATLGSEMLQSIYISVKQTSNVSIVGINEEQEGNEVKVGNIFKIFPEIVQVLKDPNLATNVDIGMQLIVKHKNDNGTFTATAIIEVTSIATTILNAKIIKIYGKGPMIGDYVFLIKK